MKFRYFFVEGASKEAYLKSELTEIDQRLAVTDKLLKQRDDIEAYRLDRDGRLCSLIFKEGRQPPGMIRAHASLPKKEVRPHGKSKEAKPMRDFFESIRVTEDCQKMITKQMNLPSMVFGSHSGSRSGLAAFGSRIGHVGPHLVAEVPEPDNDHRGEGYKPFAGHEDLKEMEFWQYAKLQEENKDYERDPKSFVLQMREH
jgi:hypothetical protein